MSTTAKKTVLLAGLLLLVGAAYVMLTSRDAAKDTPKSGETTSIKIMASGLDTPWKTVELPDGELLATERDGRLLRIGRDRQSHTVEGVYPTGEGGLLGLALHPDFANNGFLYVYLTAKQGEKTLNRVERYHYDQDRLSERKTIIEAIPGASTHDGGALAFGSDGLLYVSTGDAQKERLAQDTSSLAGKILRVTDEGTIPGDNPFGNAVYSYGHRNPQGLAWDDQGQLWAVEHGPSAHDELNRIQKGGNYGWPEIIGDETRQGMLTPAVHSGADDTWAPSGLAYAGGSLYFGGLRGQALYEARLAGETVVEVLKHLNGSYGRLRGVTAVDNGLLVNTSNRDGRGRPVPGDDRILRVPLSSLE